MSQKRHSIVNEISENELTDVILELIDPLLLKNDRYKQIHREIAEIYDRNPNVRSVLEFDEKLALNSQEIEALMEIRNLELELRLIEHRLVCLATQKNVMGLFLESYQL